MLLKILQCIDSPQIRNYLAPDVSSAGDEKPWPRFVISLGIINSDIVILSFLLHLLSGIIA